MRAKAVRLCGCVCAAVLGAIAVPSSRGAPPNDAAAASPEVEAAQLVLAAEAAIRSGDAEAAETALRRSLALPENVHSARTLELLGVVRERRGDSAEARRIYSDYLWLYASEPEADRVRQRLAAAEAVEPGELRETTGIDRRSWRVDTRGAFSQWYLYDRSRSDFVDEVHTTDAPATDRRINIDELLTTADFTLSATGPETSIELEGAAAYVDEYRPIVLVGSDRQQGSYSMLYARSLEITNEALGLSAKTGRQTRFSDGIFGRFDGTLLGWQLAPRTKLNVFTGQPVWSPRDISADSSRTFRGSSVEFAPTSGSWGMSVHWLEQTANGLMDRSSVGAQVRRSTARGSFLAYIDYDRFFEQVNAAHIRFNHNFADGSSLSLTGRRTHDPLLALTNSIIGQPVPEIDSVRAAFDAETIESLARDRTLESRSATLTYSKPIGAKLRFIGDATLARTNGSPAGGGVPEFAASGAEHYLGVQLIGTGFIGSRDVWIAGLRSAELQHSKFRVLDLSAWLPVGERLLVAPRLQFADVEQNADSGGSRRLAPSVRFVLGLSRRTQLDASIGRNNIEQVYDGPTLLGQRREEGLGAYIGYRVLF